MGRLIHRQSSVPELPFESPIMLQSTKIAYLFLNVTSFKLLFHVMILSLCK